MSAPLATWLATPLDPEVARAVERLRDAPDVARVALMPDVHLAEEVCVGTVLATRRRLYPAAVGGDIGCGMAALRFDGPASLLEDPGKARAVLRLLGRLVPPMARPPALLLPPPEAVEALTLSAPGLQCQLYREAARQLGTLGRGNHFIELQQDDQGALWAMVHSGSRGLGPAIRDHHLRHAEPGPGGLASLDAESEAGAAYLQDIACALAWAEANRALLLEAISLVVSEVLGLSPVAESRLSCQHNHARRETWGGEPLWVHRKGAIPAAEGEPGIIPGSMGSPSYHVEGRGHPDALGSSSHGAGRTMSRSEARARLRVSELRRQMRGVCFDEVNAAALVEEAPAAYRDIGAVMYAQRALTRIVRRLRPMLSYKGC